MTSDQTYRDGLESLINPTLEQAKMFFGILDSTWRNMGIETKLTYVDEILENPTFRRAFKRQLNEETDEHERLT